MDKSSGTRGDLIRKASRQRREQEKEQLRRTILKAAGELFLECGYDGFSMRHLAEKIGYSPATLYLYYRDKDDLLFTVVDEGFARFSEQLSKASGEGGDPWKRLRELAQVYITFGLSNPVHYQLMFMWRTDYLAQPRTGERKPRHETFLVLQEAVQSALDAGVMREGDAGDISDALWAVMHGIVALGISVPMFDAERIRKMSRVAQEMVYRAFYKE